MERTEEIEKESNKYSHEKESIKDYLEQLNDTQWKGYLIAKQYLKSSFHLTKSNGYIEYKKSLLK
jgi:hypothetical protein